jgi:DNA-binding MarR family transcriptional regulator
MPNDPKISAKDSPENARAAALAAALGRAPQRSTEDGVRDRERRRRLLNAWRNAAADLVDEIVATGERLAAARSSSGRRLLRTNPAWRLLCAVERSSYCLSIADAARLTSMSRQAAQKPARAAAAAGWIELQPNVGDRRVLQLALTPLGRSVLGAARAAQREWLIGLLSGIATRELGAAAGLLSGIRHQLLHDERALAQGRRTRER